MVYGLEFYVVAAFVVLLTGISKSGFGAGIEMMAVPVMALFIAPQAAAAIMLPILIAIDWANFWRYRHHWIRRIVILMIPAAVMGIGLGAATFGFVNADLLRFGLGVLALLFVGQLLLGGIQGRPQRKPGRVATMLLGLLGGFTSFVAHAGGPPMKMVLLSERLPKQMFVGTNSYLFGVINFLKLFPYFFLGQLSAENLTVSLSLAPFVPVGVVLGFWLNGVVPQEAFNRIIIAALALVGTKLIGDGLAAWV